MGPSLIEQAIGRAGGRSGVARACGVSVEAVRQWLLPGRGVPAKRAVEIERATSGAVTRYDLRPDIFGAPPVSAPAAAPNPEDGCASPSAALTAPAPTVEPAREGAT